MTKISPQRALKIKDLTVSYPNGLCALDAVSVEIPFGAITALVGVNGSGKSTLFKSLMGIVNCKSGTITIDEQSVAQAMRRNMISYVPQSEDVDWDFPVLVRDVVMMGRYGRLGVRKTPRRADFEAVEMSLARVGLEALSERQIGALSGGQRKRVFLARALAQDAEIILLDEPFTGVDVTTETAIIKILGALRDAGRLLLVSTHNLGSVPEFCDRTILIKNRILAEGLTREVFSRDNLERAFGGVLRHFTLGGARLHEDEDERQVTVISDDERPFVIYDLGKKNKEKQGDDE